MESALQAQAQNLMHWTAFGFGLGIAAYFGVPREPGPLVFLAASLSAGLCVGLAIRFRTGIARLLIVIAALAGGFAWSQYRAHAVSGPVLSERFYGAVQGRVVGIDRSLSEKPRLTLDHLVLGSLPQRVTPNRLRVALHGRAQEKMPQIGDIVLLAAHLSPPPGPAEPYGYDFQRQAWFAQLGAVGYTRSPVMIWRAAGLRMTGTPSLKNLPKGLCHLGSRLWTKDLTRCAPVKPHWWLCKIGGLSRPAVALIWRRWQLRGAWQDASIARAGCNGSRSDRLSDTGFGTAQSCGMRKATIQQALKRVNRCGSGPPICPVL